MTAPMTTELDRPLSLDPRTVRQFADNGFVRLDQVLPPATLQAREPDITAKVVELNTVDLPMEERSTTQKAFMQVGNLWRHSDAARDLVFSRRLAGIAAQLLEVDAVRLYADQALYKEPDGGITPWHADQYYWPLATDRVCTVWIPLQNTPAEMGPLSFAVGSYRFEYGRDLPISDESEQRLQEALAREGFPTDTRPYRLGDVSYHRGWTFHRAERNVSSEPRRVMTAIYMDAEMRVADQVHERQRGDLEILMPGAVEGQLVDTPLNPVVYP